MTLPRYFFSASFIRIPWIMLEPHQDFHHILLRLPLMLFPLMPLHNTSPVGLLILDFSILLVLLPPGKTISRAFSDIKVFAGLTRDLINNFVFSAVATIFS